MIYTNINGITVPTKAMYCSDSTGAQKPIRSLYCGANQIYPDGVGWFNIHGKTMHPATQYEMGSAAAGSPWNTFILNWYTPNILADARSGWYINSGFAYIRNDTGSTQTVRVHIAAKAWTGSKAGALSRQITQWVCPSAANLQSITAASHFWMTRDSAAPAIVSISSAWITVPAGYVLYPMLVCVGTDNGRWYYDDTLEDIVVQIEPQTW